VLVADEGGTDTPTPEEVFLRAIDIVEEIEDKLVLLERTLIAKWALTDEDFGTYAAGVRNWLPHVLFLVLRQFNRVKDALREALDTLAEPPQSEP
jgi:hypothetical protein